MKQSWTVPSAAFVVAVAIRAKFSLVDKCSRSLASMPNMSALVLSTSRKNTTGTLGYLTGVLLGTVLTAASCCPGGWCIPSCLRSCELTTSVFQPLGPLPQRQVLDSDELAKERFTFANLQAFQVGFHHNLKPSVFWIVRKASCGSDEDYSNMQRKRAPHCHSTAFLCTELLSGKILRFKWNVKLYWCTACSLKCLRYPMLEGLSNSLLQYIFIALTYWKVTKSFVSMRIFGVNTLQ